MDYKKLLAKIEDIFLNEDQYVMKKVVEEFEIESKFVGDVYTFLMYEHIKNSSPIIYQVGGPYDLISKKAPQQALAWQDGKLILNEDFTEYVDVRTGAMDSLVVKLLGRKMDKNSKVLILGSGKTAFWSAKILKVQFPELGTISYINSTETSNLDFEKRLSEEGLVTKSVSKNDIALYDYIFCHTSAKSPVLTSDLISQTKKDCLITTAISSVEHGEVADEFYSKKANVILDWEVNMEKAKDLKRALESGNIEKSEVITIKDLIEGKKVSADKDYTLFRSQGTPMQNLAVLKTLIDARKDK